jgi:hypothetical protein
MTLIEPSLKARHSCALCREFRDRHIWDWCCKSLMVCVGKPSGSDAVKCRKQRHGGSWPRRSGLGRRSCSPRDLHAAFGTENVTGYMSLSYGWSSCHSCSSTNREVIAARLASPCELQSMVLTGLAAAYLGKVGQPLGGD